MRLMTIIIAFVALISISFTISFSTASVVIVTPGSFSPDGQQNKNEDVVGVGNTFNETTSDDQEFPRQCSVATCNRRYPNCCPGYRCAPPMFGLGGLRFCHYIVPPLPAAAAAAAAAAAPLAQALAPAPV